MDESTSKCKFCGEKIFSPEEACPHCGKYEKGRQIITQSGWSQKFEPKEPVIGDGWYLYDHAKEDKKQFQKKYGMHLRIIASRRNRFFRVGLQYRRYGMETSLRM